MTRGQEYEQEKNRAKKRKKRREKKRRKIVQKKRKRKRRDEKSVDGTLSRFRVSVRIQDLRYGCRQSGSATFHLLFAHSLCLFTFSVMSYLLYHVSSSLSLYFLSCLFLSVSFSLFLFFFFSLSLLSVIHEVLSILFCLLVNVFLNFS